MDAIICDKCGKLVADSECRNNLRIIYKTPDDILQRDCDLCPSCQEEILGWFAKDRDGNNKEIGWQHKWNCCF